MGADGNSTGVTTQRANKIISLTEQRHRTNRINKIRLQRNYLVDEMELWVILQVLFLMSEKLKPEWVLSKVDINELTV